MIAPLSSGSGIAIISVWIGVVSGSRDFVVNGFVTGGRDCDSETRTSKEKELGFMGGEREKERILGERKKTQAMKAEIR